MLTILHTADLHLGHISRQLDGETARKLARARLGAVDTILGLAIQLAMFGDQVAHVLDAAICHRNAGLF